MIPAKETFDGTFPFKPHYSAAPGFRMHYVDEGQGSAVLCLHGEPTWGYLYREMIPILSKRHRVVVPDYMASGRVRRPKIGPTRRRRTSTILRGSSKSWT